MRAEIYLQDQEISKLSMKSSSLSSMLNELASAVIEAKRLRVSQGGLDNLPADLFWLSEMAGKIKDNCG